jgi:hypothetical protein
VWKPYVIKETQYSDFEEIIDNGKCEQNGQRFSIEANAERSPVTHHTKPAIASNTASPSCSDFEAFLDKVAVKQSSKNDAYWEICLEREKQRLATDLGTRMITVNDMLLGDSSDDDNVPIASTLSAKNRNLSLLVDVATTATLSPSIRRKKTPKVTILTPLPTPPPHNLNDI